jgi:hypothetical protein
MKMFVIANYHNCIKFYLLKLLIQMNRINSSIDQEVKLFYDIRKSVDQKYSDRAKISVWPSPLGTTDALNLGYYFPRFYLITKIHKVG